MTGIALTGPNGGTFLNDAGDTVTWTISNGDIATAPDGSSVFTPDASDPDRIWNNRSDKYIIGTSGRRDGFLEFSQEVSGLEIAFHISFDDNETVHVILDGQLVDVSDLVASGEATWTGSQTTINNGFISGMEPGRQTLVITRPFTSIGLDHNVTQRGVGFDLIIDSAPPPVVCFSIETMIATSSGLEAIENLNKGDMVLTMDHGYQKLKWLGSRKISMVQLMSNPKLRPVRITAGALGQGLPERDLLVSRQHRMLVRSHIAKRIFDQDEVLVPAIKLCELPSIFVDEEVKEVEYFHMLFDAHEVVYAEGAPSESLYTGPEALKALSVQAREEIFALFPEMAEPDYLPIAARPFPAGKKQKQLVERHKKNSRELLFA